VFVGRMGRSGDVGGRRVLRGGHCLKLSAISLWSRVTRHVLTRIGRVTIVFPAHCNRSWIARAVSLCRKPCHHLGRWKISLPAKKVTRGNSLATSRQSSSAVATTSVPVLVRAADGSLSSAASAR